MKESLWSRRPCLPVRLEDVSDLSVRHAVFAGNLKRRAVDEVEHNRVWQLLAVEVGDVWHPELRELVFLSCAALMFHRLGDGEADVACLVNFDYAAFPQLRLVSV